MNAIIYAAKSTEDKRGSIPTQLEDARSMAEREGWPVAGEYTHEAASAYHGNRGPGLTAAMEHAEREAPATLVVQHSDRLARGDGKQARHLGEIYFWAIKHNVELRSVQDDSTFTNPLLTFAMGERNAEDSRRKSLATRAGMKRRAARGLYTGRRPYGYRHTPGTPLAVAAHEARIVRRIFAEFLAGRSMVAIARGLHSDRVPTASGKATWRQAQVSGILRNPIYAGLLRYDGETTEGQHEAIVDAETWRQTSELLAARGPSRGKGRPPRGNHLFRNGMLRCGSCGDAMVPRTKTRPSFQTYYCCTGHIQLGDDYCSQGCVSRADVDEAVYSYFERVGLDLEATREALREGRDRKLSEVRAALRDAEQEARRATERLERVRRDYTDGKLDADDWRDFRAELTEELAGAEAEVNRLREQAQEVESWGELRDAEADTLRALAEIRRAVVGEIRDAKGVDAVRAALLRLFKEFVIYPGEGRIEPKRRAPVIEYDLSDMSNPEVQVLSPSRVPLDLAGNKYAETSGCL